MTDWLDAVRWDAQGLVPAIAQDAASGSVLMLAWMDRRALELSASLGRAVYYSRSRARLWYKGEESGHVQQVHEIRLDCDGDVVLLKVTQLGHEPGIACHTGRQSCFYQRLLPDPQPCAAPAPAGSGAPGESGTPAAPALQPDAPAPTRLWQAVDPVLKDPEHIYR